MREAGKGKYSVVYEAVRKSDGQHCALKRVQKQCLANSQTRVRVLQEVELLHKISHINIVTHGRYFLENDDLFLEIQWADGGDLKSVIRQRARASQPFAEAQIWLYFTQIARAVRHMHARRIMHRDLKPANVFLTKDGSVLVGDLGLGKWLEENTQETHSRVGTPLYMAPQVLKGKGYDFKSDIWSLGCILYELACLKSPFKSGAPKNELVKLMQHVIKGVYPPIDPELGYSAGLVSLSTSMLSFEPEHRPDASTVCAFAESMLAACLERDDRLAVPRGVREHAELGGASDLPSQLAPPALGSGSHEHHKNSFASASSSSYHHHHPTALLSQPNPHHHSAWLPHPTLNVLKEEDDEEDADPAEHTASPNLPISGANKHAQPHFSRPPISPTSRLNPGGSHPFASPSSPKARRLQTYQSAPTGTAPGSLVGSRGVGDGDPAGGASQNTDEDDDTTDSVVQVSATSAGSLPPYSTSPVPAGALGWRRHSPSQAELKAQVAKKASLTLVIPPSGETVDGPVHVSSNSSASTATMPPASPHSAFGGPGGVASVKSPRLSPRASPPHRQRRFSQGEIEALTSVTMSPRSARLRRMRPAGVAATASALRSPHSATSPAQVNQSQSLVGDQAKGRLGLFSSGYRLDDSVEDLSTENSTELMASVKGLERTRQRSSTVGPESLPAVHGDDVAVPHGAPTRPLPRMGHSRSVSGVELSRYPRRSISEDHLQSSPTQSGELPPPRSASPASSSSGVPMTPTRPERRRTVGVMDEDHASRNADGSLLPSTSHGRQFRSSRYVPDTGGEQGEPAHRHRRSRSERASHHFAAAVSPRMSLASPNKRFDFGEAPLTPTPPTTRKHASGSTASYGGKTAMSPLVRKRNTNAEYSFDHLPPVSLDDMVNADLPSSGEVHNQMRHHYRRRGASDFGTMPADSEAGSVEGGVMPDGVASATAGGAENANSGARSRASLHGLKVMTRRPGHSNVGSDKVETPRSARFVRPGTATATRARSHSAATGKLPLAPSASSSGGSHVGAAGPAVPVPPSIPSANAVGPSVASVFPPSTIDAVDGASIVSGSGPGGASVPRGGSSGAHPQSVAGAPASTNPFAAASPGSRTAQGQLARGSLIPPASLMGSVGAGNPFGSTGGVLPSPLPTALATSNGPPNASSALPAGRGSAAPISNSKFGLWAKASQRRQAEEAARRKAAEEEQRLSTQGAVKQQSGGVAVGGAPLTAAVELAKSQSDPMIDAPATFGSPRSGGILKRAASAPNMGGGGGGGSSDSGSARGGDASEAWHVAVDDQGDEAMGVGKALRATPGSPPGVSRSASPMKYILGDRIGEGSFAQVYRAIDAESGRIFAVKQMSIESARNEENARTLAKEIELLKNLRHPNLVRYLGTHRTSTQFNIFLEYCTGGSIAQMLKQFGRFPEPLIRMYTRQMTEALAYLHEHGIVHRDVKGANVLVNGQTTGIAKLSDFGCSKRAPQDGDDLDADQSLMRIRGTVLWMAPECAQQSPHVNTSSDIWSLGATVIEMATGKPPWAELNIKEEITALLKIATTKEPPKFPSDLSPEGIAFLSRCMPVAPEKRWSAKKLLGHPFVRLEEGSKGGSAFLKAIASRATTAATRVMAAAGEDAPASTRLAVDIQETETSGHAASSASSRDLSGLVSGLDTVGSSVSLSSSLPPQPVGAALGDGGGSPAIGRRSGGGKKLLSSEPASSYGGTSTSVLGSTGANGASGSGPGDEVGAENRSEAGGAAVADSHLPGGGVAPSKQAVVQARSQAVARVMELLVSGNTSAKLWKEVCVDNVECVVPNNSFACLLPLAGPPPERSIKRLVRGTTQTLQGIDSIIEDRQLAKAHTPAVEGIRCMMQELFLHEEAATVMWRWEVAAHVFGTDPPVSSVTSGTGSGTFVGDGSGRLSKVHLIWDASGFLREISYPGPATALGTKLESAVPVAGEPGSAGVSRRQMMAKQESNAELRRDSRDGDEGWEQAAALPSRSLSAPPEED